MSGFRFNTVAPLTALVLSVAWTGAWLSGLLIDNGSWPMRLGMLAVGLLLCAAPAALLLGRSRCQCRSAMQHLEVIAEMNSDAARSDSGIEQLPPLSPSNPWRAAIDGVEQAIASLRERNKDAEHDRSSLEIRCRRVTSQYERIKTILTGIDDPILAIDDYDEVVLANPSAEAIFDHEAFSTEQRALARLLHSQKLVDLLTTTSRRKASDSRTDEVEIVDHDGQAHWYRATATKLSRAEASARDGASGGAVAVLRDIDDQKAIQRRNAEFVSSVSHEMKTPLAGIKAYVELLADGDAEDEETREEFLDVINGQADRLQRLVDNMLNLARIEAGVVKVNKESRSLNELLEEAFHVVQPAAEAKQLELGADLSPMYLGVLADRDMLLQAAINLLSNAIKYTATGGRVTLRSWLEDNHVCFAVADTGVGLSEEDCEKVFEKFYRVSKDKNMASGTGLGLPLAKHIVEDVHRGALQASSVLGEGSTFTVTLPNAGQMT